jgi:hypothetical protein
MEPVKGWKEPSRHEAQAPEPVLAWKRPAAQGVQPLELEVEYWPAAHGLAEAAPSSQ